MGLHTAHHHHTTPPNQTQLLSQGAIDIRGVQNTKKWYELAPKLIPFLWQILAHMQKISPLGALERPAHDTSFNNGSHQREIHEK